MKQEPTEIVPTLIDLADRDQEIIVRETRAVSWNGETVRYMERGAGETIICVPMVKELNFVYMPQIKALSDRFRMVVYEPRLRTTRRYGIADRAREILELNEKLGVPKVHLLAWSDAGSAAYYFAKQWPEHCHSTIYLGLSDRYRFSQPLDILSHLLYRLPLEHFIPGSVLAWIISGYLAGDKVRRRWIVDRVRAIPRFTKLFKHSVLPNLIEHRPRAGEVSVPSLVLIGDRDALVTVKEAQGMAALFAQETNCIVIPGGEHFLGYVHSDPVNEAIRSFCESVKT